MRPVRVKRYRKIDVPEPVPGFIIQMASVQTEAIREGTHLEAFLRILSEEVSEAITSDIERELLEHAGLPRDPWDDGDVGMWIVTVKRFPPDTVAGAAAQS